MGDVYVAKHRDTRMIVALKCLRARYRNNLEMASRMHREAQLQARIHHPNIVAVFDASVDDGTLWMAMELLEGHTLREKLREGRLSIVDALYIALKTANGMMEAHEQNAVHRDLKPENIFVTTAREIKVLDFGVAKLYGRADFPSTDRRITLGTAHYMSPEHLHGERVDARTDIYALGLILYEMLAGFHAFTVEGEMPTSDQVSQMHFLRKPLPPLGRSASFPDYVWAIIERALQKWREDRYASMVEMAKDLHAAGQRALAEGEMTVLFVGVDSPPASGTGGGEAPETAPLSPVARGAGAFEGVPEPPSANRYWVTRPRSAKGGERALPARNELETVELKAEPAERKSRAAHLALVPSVLPFRPAAAPAPNGLPGEAAEEDEETAPREARRELSTEPLQTLALEPREPLFEDVPTQPVGARPPTLTGPPRARLCRRRRPRRCHPSPGQIGQVAQVEAALDFDASRGDFKTLVKWRVRFAILTAVEKELPHKEALVCAAYMAVCCGLGEAADPCDSSYLVSGTAADDQANADAFIGELLAGAFAGVVGEVLRGEGEEGIAQRQLYRRAVEAVREESATLPDPWQELLDLHYGQGIDLKVIARMRNLHYSTIREHHRMALAALSKKLARRGLRRGADAGLFK